MVIVNPIPGQESRNSDFLLENGAAIKINNVATLAYSWAPAGRPGASGRLKENARRLGRPQAALTSLGSAGLARGPVGQGARVPRQISSPGPVSRQAGAVFRECFPGHGYLTTADGC